MTRLFSTYFSSSILPAVSNWIRTIPVLILCCSFLSATKSQADEGDDRMTLGVQAVAIADVKEGVLGTKAPKIGVVILRKEPGCDIPFNQLDIITHIDRKAIDSAEEFKTVVASLAGDKKHRLTYQRSIGGKWQKGDIDFKPKSYKETVLASMEADKDAVAETTTFRDKRSPSSPQQTDLQCRILETKSGNDALLVRYSYGGDDWIFFDECVVKVDGESTKVKFKDIKHDNSGGRVWEWCTRVATEDDLKLLRSIAKANVVTIRFVGSKYKHDHEMSDEERLAIWNTLEAYRLRKVR